MFDAAYTCVYLVYEQHSVTFRANKTYLPLHDKWPIPSVLAQWAVRAQFASCATLLEYSKPWESQKDLKPSLQTQH